MDKIKKNKEISPKKNLQKIREDNHYSQRKVAEDNNTYQEVMVPKEFTPLKESTEIGTLAGTMLLDKASFKKSGIINYRLRMWVADDAILTDIQKSFGVKVSIKAKVDLDK